MFGLVVRFDLHDAAAAREFDDLVSETLPEIHTREPGTRLYVVHSVEGSPNSRIFYEMYSDRAAFDAHEEQPHVKRFLREREQYISLLRVEFLTRIDGTVITDI